ncbi:MAG: alpha/beta hydrolase [Bdellovibrionota bacterium]
MLKKCLWGFNIIFKVFVIFIFMILLSSCNHLFYYPTQNMVATPKNLKLKYDNLTIKTQDGVELNAWLVHAKNEKPIATVIHFHGNGENISNHFFYFAWLAHLGFDVLEFDYRGYGKSQGIPPTREGLIQDGLAAIAWAQANARSKELFIIAQSLGGAVAIPTYVINKVQGIQAIILDSTFASYREITRKKLSKFWLTWPLHWPLGFLISDELSSIDYIKNIDIPLVFVHSESDPVVPYESGHLLYEAAPEEAKELWIVPWGGHTTAFVMETDNQFRKKLVSFLCGHLKKKNVGCRDLCEDYRDPVL